MSKSVSKRKPAKRKTATKRKRPITADDLLRIQFVSDPQISPDGRSILFVKKHADEKNDYTNNLWIVDADGGEPRQFTSGGKDTHPRWSPDGSRIAFISKREKPKWQIYIQPVGGGEATPLTRFPEGSLQSFRWSPDGSMLAVSFRETAPEWTDEAKNDRETSGGSTPPRVLDNLYYRLDGDGYFGAQRYDLYIVDAETGEHRLLRRDRGGWFEYDWSPDSTELVVASNVSRHPWLNWWKDELFRVVVDTGKCERIEGVPLGVKGIVRWSPDGREIAFAGREGKESWGVRNTRLYVWDLKRREIRDLTGDEDYCLSAATVSDTADPAFGAHFQWSPDSSRLIMEIGWQGGAHTASISRDGGPLTFHTEGRQAIWMGNLSADGRRLALTVCDPLQPAEIALGTLNGKKRSGTLQIDRLTRFNDTLIDQLELSSPEPHWIDSADGTKVHLWVMQPVGAKSGRKHPAVLEIHGGPHAQYGETFFHEFQLLAAAGYVVVYSNPRGSKGYGEAHCKAIKGSWGQADWRDMQAVIEFMKQQPSIDSSRMGVMGGSYGGYMTNWAIGHCHDFAAAITDRCVSNLVTMVGTSDLPLVPGKYWDGNCWDNTETIWEQSPLKHFGNVKTPTLIIHCEGDLRCNVEQAEQVFAALQLQKVPSRFVRYPKEASHGMSRIGPPDLRLHRLGQILAWWDEYLNKS